MSPIQFSYNCNYSLITHDKTPVHSTWGLLRVCAAYPTPRLDLGSKLRPSWEQHPRYQIHAGYNSTLHLPVIWRAHTIFTRYSTESFTHRFFILRENPVFITSVGVRKYCYLTLYYMLDAQIFLQSQRSSHRSINPLSEPWLQGSMTS